MIHGSIFHELVNGCFLGVMKKNRHERLLSLVVGLISWDFQQRPFFFGNGVRSTNEMEEHGELQQQFAHYDATMSIYGLILYRLSLTEL